MSVARCVKNSSQLWIGEGDYSLAAMGGSLVPMYMKPSDGLILISSCQVKKLHSFDGFVFGGTCLTLQNKSGIIVV